MAREELSRAPIHRAGLLDERRREPRYASERLVPVVYNMSQLRVWMTQCSARGVAILSPMQMILGEQFMVQVQLTELALLIYTVRNCRSEDAEVFRVGAELSRISAPAEATYDRILAALLGTETKSG